MSPRPGKQKDIETAEPPSRSEMKRRASALQQLGKELAELSPELLAAMNLPSDLDEALADLRDIGSHEARRRQMQYVGKVMRDLDPDPLREALETIRQGRALDTEALHRAEGLREELIAGGPDELAAFCDAWPGADRQRLGQLVRNARKEREANKPPKAYRQLFRYLKEITGEDT